MKQETDLEQTSIFISAMAAVVIQIILDIAALIVDIVETNIGGEK